MKNPIADLGSLLYGLAIGATLIACSEDVEKPSETCQMIKFGDFSQHNYNYDSIGYNANGTIASVTWRQPGGDQRFDYAYASNKISIFKTDLVANHQLVCEIGIDSQGRPVSRTEDYILYERYVYSGDRLDHIMWSTKDSIAFTYDGSGKNPTKSEFYQYQPSNKTWSKLHTTTFTFDEKPNPLKGLILPIENWNMEAYFFENNRTLYSSNNNDFVLAYTYNSDGYPTSRTLTFTGFSEKKEFSYDCD